jgi:hypothetical protein
LWRLIVEIDVLADRARLGQLDFGW